MVIPFASVFLSKRFQNQIDIEQDESSCVQDRTIYEDARIFAQTLRKRGFMSDRDWENYQALFASMAGQLKRPDLVIYLKSDVESLVKRIAQRGREFEKSIDTDYLGDLNQAYDQWCAGREDKLLVATIDTTSGADEEEVFSEALRLLKTKLQIELPFKHV